MDPEKKIMLLEKLREAILRGHSLAHLRRYLDWYVRDGSWYLVYLWPGRSGKRNYTMLLCALNLTEAQSEGLDLQFWVNDQPPLSAFTIWDLERVAHELELNLIAQPLEHFPRLPLRRPEGPLLQTIRKMTLLQEMEWALRHPLGSP